jgi:serine protease Do
MIGDIKPGESVALTVIRDGASRNINVRIEARSDEVAADSKKLWPGVTVVTMTEEIRSGLKLDKDAPGLYVIQVINETPAAIVGLQRGDRITAINDTPVRDVASFYKTLREKTDKELWFSFIRGDSTLDSLKFRR